MARYLGGTVASGVADGGGVLVDGIGAVVEGVGEVLLGEELVSLGDTDESGIVPLGAGVFFLLVPVVVLEGELLVDDPLDSVSLAPVLPTLLPGIVLLLPLLLLPVCEPMLPGWVAGCEVVLGI